MDNYMGYNPISDIAIIVCFIVIALVFYYFGKSVGRTEEHKRACRYIRRTYKSRNQFNRR